MQNIRIDITFKQASHYDNCHNANNLYAFSQIKAAAVALISLQLRPPRIQRPIYVRRPEKQQDICRNQQQRLWKENRRHKEKPPDPIADHSHRQKTPRRKTHIANIGAKKRHTYQGCGDQT